MKHVQPMEEILILKRSKLKMALERNYIVLHHGNGYKEKNIEKVYIYIYIFDIIIFNVVFLVSTVKKL